MGRGFRLLATLGVTKGSRSDPSGGLRATLGLTRGERRGLGDNENALGWRRVFLTVGGGVGIIGPVFGGGWLQRSATDGSHRAMARGVRMDGREGYA